jgi:hypothetical protein
LRNGLINSGGVAICGQVFSREIAEVNVVGPNALEDSLGPLRSPNDGELGDEIVLTGLLQRLELGGAGMGEMVKIEWVGDEALQTFVCVR